MIAIHSTKRQRGLIWFGAARAIIGRNGVPRGTMDEVSSYVRLDLLSARRQGRPKDCSTSSSNPMMEGPWCRFRREARARERHRHCGGGWSESDSPETVLAFKHLSGFAEMQ